MDTLLKQPTSRDAAPTNEPKYLCGCGLSRTFPICDGSQAIAKTHKAGMLVRCGAPQQSIGARQVDGEDAASPGHAPDRESPA